MTPTEYILLTDPQVANRVRARYADEFKSLSALGFRQLCFYMEQLGPFSAALQLPMLLLMLTKREVLILPPPLRLAAGFIILYQTDPPAIAVPMGMGVKIYTDFMDQTLLISCTFSSYAVPRPGSLITKQMSPDGIDEVWRLHRQRVLELEGNGKAAVPHSSFQSYVSMSRREEDLSQYLDASAVGSVRGRSP
jgi:hypothetical protein